MTFITFTATAGGKAVIMNMGGLTSSPEVDYREVIIKINSIATIVLEERDEDGINIMMNNGEKYNINQTDIDVPGVGTFKTISAVGTYTGAEIDTNKKVFDKLIEITAM